MLKFIAINLFFLALIATIVQCKNTTTNSSVAETTTIKVETPTTPKPDPSNLRFFSSLGTTEYLGKTQKSVYTEYYLSDVKVSYCNKKIVKFRERRQLYNIFKIHILDDLAKCFVVLSLFWTSTSSSA